MGVDPGTATPKAPPAGVHPEPAGNAVWTSEVGAALHAEKEKLAAEIDAVAGFLRHARDELRERSQAREAGCADWACVQAERLSAFLRTREVGELAEGFRRLGRYQPLLLAGAAAVIGFGLARLLRSPPRGGEPT